ncbi:MAG: hypothetical protein ABIT36_07310, partial [Steroidobacteraceae bacterium]
MLKGDDFDRRAVNNVADMLRHVPGVFAGAVDGGAGTGAAS